MPTGALPVTREPLERDEEHEHGPSRRLVAVPRRARIEPLKHLARATEVAVPQQPDALVRGGAVPERERPREPLLDRDAPLEEARRDLERVRLEPADLREHLRDECRVAGPLRLGERRARMHQTAADVASVDAVPGELAEDLRTPHVVVGRLDEGVLEQRDRRTQVGTILPPGEGREDVRALDTGVRLREERLEDRARPLAVAGEEVELGRAEPPAAGARVIVHRRELGGRLEDPRRGRGRAAGRRAICSAVESRGDPCVGAVGREREVACALLDVANDLGEDAVDRAPAEGRRLLVTDRGQQLLREADATGLDRDHAFALRLLQPLEDLRPIAVNRGDDVDRRTSRGSDRQEDVTRLRGQTGKAVAEELLQAVWDLESRIGACHARVRVSSRPSSRAKNGLPSLASSTAESSGRERSRASQSFSSVRSSGGDSGSSATTFHRPFGKARARSEDVAPAVVA